MCRWGVATNSRLLKIIGLFCRIWSLLQGSFAKETFPFKEPTNRRHLLYYMYLLVLCQRPARSHIECAYISTHTHSHTHVPCVKKREMCMYMYIYTYLFICIYTYICMYMLYMGMCIYTHALRAKTCAVGDSSFQMHSINSKMSVLQCVAVCCSVLQCVAVCCGVLQCVAVCCSVL